LQTGVRFDQKYMPLRLVRMCHKRSDHIKLRQGSGRQGRRFVLGGCTKGGYLDLLAKTASGKSEAALVATPRDAELVTTANHGHQLVKIHACGEVGRRGTISASIFFSSVAVSGAFLTSTGFAAAFMLRAPSSRSLVTLSSF